MVALATLALEGGCYLGGVLCGSACCARAGVWMLFSEIFISCLLGRK